MRRLLAKFNRCKIVGIHIMRLPLVMLLGAFLGGFSGCTTVRSFHGVVSNLREDGQRSTNDFRTTARLACNSVSADGRPFWVFSLEGQNCWVVIFHPQTEEMHSFGAKTDSGQISAWLIRYNKPRCSSLARDPGKILAEAAAEPLKGHISYYWQNSRSYFLTVSIKGEDRRTVIAGDFEGCRVLVGPAAGALMYAGELIP